MAVIHLCAFTAPVTSTRGATSLRPDMGPTLAAPSFTQPQLHLSDRIYEIWNRSASMLISKKTVKKTAEGFQMTKSSELGADFRNLVIRHVPLRYSTSSSGQPTRSQRWVNFRCARGERGKKKKKKPCARFPTSHPNMSPQPRVALKASHLHRPTRVTGCDRTCKTPSRRHPPAPPRGLGICRTASPSIMQPDGSPRVS